MEKKEKQIDQLLAEYDYFEEKNLSMSPKHALNNLLQEEKMIYPSEFGFDGFYMARLIKN